MENIFNEILPELLMAAGGDAGDHQYDRTRFLNSAMPVFIEKLNCKEATVLFISEQGIQTIWPDVAAIKDERIFPGFSEADLVSRILPGPHNGTWLSKSGLQHYIFTLDKAVYLILSARKRFEEELIEILQPLVRSLAQTYRSIEKVTGLRNAEEALKQERNLLRTILDNIPDPVYVKDLEGRKIMLNKAEADILNAGSVEEVIGTLDSDYYPADVAEQTKKEDLLVIRNRIPHIHKEGFVITKSGEEIWFEGNKIPYFDSNGNILGIVGISHNISKRRKIEKEKKENAEKYESIFNSFLDLYYRSDLEGNILVLSPSVYKLSGYRPEELIGNKVDLVYSDLESREKLINLLRKKGSVNDFENILVRKDGVTVPVSITSHLLCGPDGKPQFIEGSIRDISERKEAEKKLSRLLHQQNLITKLAAEFINIPLDNSDEAVTKLLAMTGQENKVDRVYIFGYDFVTNTMSNTHEWCAEGVTPEIGNLQSIPLNIFPSWVDAHKKGEMIIIPDVGSLDREDPIKQILEPQGIKTLITVPMLLDSECLGFVGFDSVQAVKEWSKEEISLLQLLADLLCNVTDRKRTEQALKTREAYLKAIFNNVPYLMWLKDLEGRYLLINKPFLDYFSFTDYDSPLGKKADELWPPSISRVFHEQDIEVLQSRELRTIEEQLDFHDKKVWFEIYRAPIIDPNGLLLGTTGIARDITSRIISDRELKTATEEAMAASIAKTRFLANMSHEIRTPLNAIIGMVRLLLESKVEEPQMKLLGNMKTSSETLLSIVNDILDFSKIESGQIQIERTDFNLNDLFRRVYNANEYRAEEKGIKLSCMADERIHIFYKGDPVHLQQILNNLVSNAIKFTQKGKVELKCELAGIVNGKERIQFIVEDTGIGISLENQKKIFNSFQQEDESITRTFGGTGLGLAISKQLVELMGGELCVESMKKMGSKFYFTIDMEKGQSIVAEVNPKHVSSKAASLKGIRVLLVEDNKFNQFIALAMLDKWNASTVCCEDGQKALDMLRSETFDLILMDIQMPVMDGLTASTIIRQELNLKTPILALTANVVMGIVERCEQAGMQGYVSKPFDEEELYSKIISVLPQSGNGAVVKPVQEEPVQLSDLSRLVKMVGNDSLMLTKMIKKFLEVTPEYIGDLSDAARLHDIDSIQRTSHKLKSAIDLVSNDTMRELIKSINDMGKTGKESEELYSMIQKFLRYFAFLEGQLTLIAEGNQGPAKG